MLYPIFTISREKYEVNGLWDFWIEGEEEMENAPLQMPVPSSYNDLYENEKIRNHIGNVFYRKKIVITGDMSQKRLILRFGAVTHKATVWINGQEAIHHVGGFLPFEVEINKYITMGENVVIVKVNNVVDYTTLPVGTLIEEKIPQIGKITTNEPNFDYFNYAGIVRPVVLYTTPKNYIEDVIITTQQDGTITYQAKVFGEGRFQAIIKDVEGNVMAKSDSIGDCLVIDEPRLWEPLNAYLYKLEMQYQGIDGKTDLYTEEFGIRSVEVRGSQFLINGKPFYFKGFGKHEDSPIHGRGFDEVVNVKDIGMMKWIGANSFRTSHYPYSEEMMRLCDREGIVVINETPACGMHTHFSATGNIQGKEVMNTWTQLHTAEHHKQVIEEMIARDKNHPCVVMWSIANEPASEEIGAYEYFKPLVELTKELDLQKRPVTIVTYEGSNPDTCLVESLCDVLAINRYFGWYNSCGQLKKAEALLRDEFIRWHERCKEKPIMVTEYGADTIVGFHETVPVMFTEEYQIEFLKMYHRVFDEMDYFIGEHIWNFADFETAQNPRRVNGNKKGLFTRERKPKSAVWYVKERWENIPNYGYKLGGL